MLSLLTRFKILKNTIGILSQWWSFVCASTICGKSYSTDKAKFFSFHNPLQVSLTISDYTHMEMHTREHLDKPVRAH